MSDDITYGVSVGLTNETEGYHFSEWAEPIEDWLTLDDGTPCGRPRPCRAPEPGSGRVRLDRLTQGFSILIDGEPRSVNSLRPNDIGGVGWIVADALTGTWMPLPVDPETGEVEVLVDSDRGGTDG